MDERGVEYSERENRPEVQHCVGLRSEYEQLAPIRGLRTVCFFGGNDTVKRRVRR